MIYIYPVEGVRFLWTQVFESTDRIAASIHKETKEDRGGSGAILAHCMGLGKTFTTITLIHTLFRYPKLTHIHRVLILCPLNTANKYVLSFFLSNFIRSYNLVGKMNFVSGLVNLNHELMFI